MVGSYFMCLVHHLIILKCSEIRKIISGILTRVGFSGGSVVKNQPQCRRCRFDPWVGKILLEKEMATHSSILPWRSIWTEEPGRLGSRGAFMGSQRVGHFLVTKQQQEQQPGLRPLCPPYVYFFFDYQL